jgi:hypothetical protein
VPSATPSSEWDPPAPKAPAQPASRAAFHLWFLVGMQMVIFVMEALGLFSLAHRPYEEFAAQMEEARWPPGTVAQAYPMLWGVGVMALVLGFLPGAAYVILAFGVRRGRAAEIGLALLLTTTQLVVGGVILLASALEAILHGQPGSMTMSVVLLGTPLAVLGLTARWLHAARGSAAGPKPGREPWDEGGRR